MGATRYCPKIDEWSVGCIMLEMLVGLCVFPGNAKRVCDCNKASHINYNEDQLSKIFKLLGTPTGPPLPLPPVQSGRVSSLPPYRSGMSRSFPRTEWTRRSSSGVSEPHCASAQRADARARTSHYTVGG